MQGTSQRKAAELLGIPQGTLNRHLKNRNSLEESEESNRKRRRNSKVPLVDEAVKEWIKQSLHRGADFLSGPIVREKAEEFAKKLDVQGDWKASEGWFSRFKKREGLGHKKLHGEAKDSDVQQRENWIETVWPSLCQQYDEENIFNADETGIYFRAMPDSTLTFRNDTRRGTKKSKERITCLLTCSMAGEKKKILVVGKSKNPRCFKNVNPLPVDYEANSNSWMTGGIWESFLRAWDKDLKKKNRKILLLADNCSAHTQVTGLSSIRVEFLPPNTTSVLQPCDMGIIRAVKAIFRKAMCRQVLQQMDESVTATACELAKKITLLDGILLMKASWEEIDSVTIRNCWVKSGLKMGPHERPAHPSQITAVPSELPMNQKQWEDFVKADDDLEVAHVLDEDEIVDTVRARHEEEDEEEEEGDDDADKEPIPSVTETRKALSTLTRGLLGRGFVDNENLLTKLERASSHVLTADLKQSTLCRFFPQH